jgi:hypothetical protein
LPCVCCPNLHSTRSPDAPTAQRDGERRIHKHTDILPVSSCGNSFVSSKSSGESDTGFMLSDIFRAAFFSFVCGTPIN